MRKMNVREAKKHLAKIRGNVAENPYGIFRLKNKEAVVKALRKTRAALWEEKLASHH